MKAPASAQTARRSCVFILPISAGSMSTMTLRAPRASRSCENAVSTRSSRAPDDEQEVAVLQREVRAARRDGARSSRKQRMVIGEQIDAQPGRQHRNAEPVDQGQQSLLRTARAERRCRPAAPDARRR